MQSLHGDGLFPETAQELSDASAEWLVYSGIILEDKKAMKYK